MLSEYQLKFANLCNITIGNVKKLVPNFFNKEKYVFHQENLKLYLRLGLKLKNIYRVLEFNQSQWLKPYIEFNTQKRIEAEKKEDKVGKELYNIMNNAIIRKNSGKLMEWNPCKTSKQQKGLFKIYIKTKLYVGQNI